MVQPRQVGFIGREKLFKKRCGDPRLTALPRQRPGFVEGLRGWVGRESLRGG